MAFFTELGQKFLFAFYFSFLNIYCLFKKNKNKMLNCFKAYLRPKVIFPSYIKDFEIYCVCMLSCFSHVQLFANLWSPPGSSVHGILQARILEWVAMPSAMGSSRPRDRTWVFYISCTGRQVLCHLGNLLTALQFVLVQCTTSSQRCNTKES